MLKNIHLNFGWRRNAGLICISHDTDQSYHGWSLHLFVQRSHWKFLNSWEEYDHCLWYFGLGPLLLLVKA